MNLTGTTALYSREVLGLAVDLARWPLVGEWSHNGIARSPTCGSMVTLGLTLDPATGTIATLGLLAEACAIGQASAALFAHAAEGHDATGLAEALRDIEGWLGGGTEPAWPGFAAIAAARDYPARHGAILLPWRAALGALSYSGAAG